MKNLLINSIVFLINNISSLNSQKSYVIEQLIPFDPISAEGFIPVGDTCVETEWAVGTKREDCAIGSIYLDENECTEVLNCCWDYDSGSGSGSGSGDDGLVPVCFKSNQVAVTTTLPISTTVIVTDPVTAPMTDTTTTNNMPVTDPITTIEPKTDPITEPITTTQISETTQPTTEPIETTQTASTAEPTLKPTTESSKTDPVTEPIKTTFEPSSVNTMIFSVFLILACHII